MMAGMLTRLPLPLLPAGAEEVAPGVGLVTGDDGGGLVSVHGLATFAWDVGDEAGRRLAAVQLVRLGAVSQVQAAAAFGVDPVTVWRWDQALTAGAAAAHRRRDRRGRRRAPHHCLRLPQQGALTWTTARRTTYPACRVASCRAGRPPRTAPPEHRHRRPRRFSPRSD
jgi:transposase-like protein